MFYFKYLTGGYVGKLDWLLIVQCDLGNNMFCLYLNYLEYFLEYLNSLFSWLIRSYAKAMSKVYVVYGAVITIRSAGKVVLNNVWTHS